MREEAAYFRGEKASPEQRQKSAGDDVRQKHRGQPGAARMAVPHFPVDGRQIAKQSVSGENAGQTDKGHQQHRDAIHVSVLAIQRPMRVQ